MTAKGQKPREFAILDALGFGVLLLDVQRRVVAVNRHAVKLLDVTEDELLGQNLAETWELVLPGGRPLTLGSRPSDQVESTGLAIRDQLIGFRGLGRPLRWTLLSLALLEPPVSDARFLLHFQLQTDQPAQSDLMARLDALVQQRSRELNDLEARFHAAQELTQRVQAELRSSEELYESVIQAMAEGVAIHEASGGIRAANDSAARILGLSMDQLLGREAIDPSWRLIDTDGRDLAPEAIPSEITAVTGESCHRRQLGVIRGNGERAWLEVSTRPLRAPPDEGPGAGRYPVVATFTDVTLEREATRALEESRARFASVLEAVPGILFRYLQRRDGRPGRFEFVSGHTKALVGLEPERILADSKHWFDRVHPDDIVAGAAAADAQDSTVDVAMRVKGPDGQWRWFRNRAVPEPHPKGMVWTGVMLDITEERKLANQVRASQRREAIATVVAGVAHNFNNALAAMIPNLEHALESSAGQQRIALEETLRTAQLAGGLVRQLMVVARQQTSGGAVVCDFAAVVRDVARLCKGLFQGRIRIEADVTERRVPVAQDASQLHQMLLNLCINARDAMQHTDSGRLSLALHEHDSAGTPGCCLEVSDNGCGMDEATQRQLGEPFFTTKPPGQGTGLGLATVYAMVRDLAGSIECTSAPGEGTQFRIWLPKSGLVPVGQSSAAELEAPQGKRVLLVDDEPLVRRALARGLRSRGWLVEEASDGMDALSYVAAGQGRFAVAVLDLSMPGMPGERVLAELKRVHPGLPVVVLSGFVGAPENLSGAFSVLEKPISTPQLSAELARAVAGNRPSGPDGARS